LVITERKAIDLVNHERREKRGGGKVRYEGSLAGDSSVTTLIDHVASLEPTPDDAARIVDNCRRLLEALEDDQLRAVALAEMEGCTNEEIAQRLKRSVPTIERKLQRIRKTRKKEMG
jgi:DNA-directed RNA polymerase specialized sigma24 family protein